MATRRMWPTSTPTPVPSPTPTYTAQPPAPSKLGTPQLAEGAPSTPTPTDNAPEGPAEASPPGDAVDAAPAASAASAPAAADAALTPVNPSPSPTPAAVPVDTATPVPSANGWSFADLQVIREPETQLMFVYGDLINNTGASQQVSYVIGTFYDSQGLVIADQEDMYDYRPIEVVPPGGRVPFELTLNDLESLADYDLKVIAQESSQTPRQDFEFSDQSSESLEGTYCVSGKLRNPGPAVAEYLLVAAVMYNAESQVTIFGTYDVLSPETVVGDATSDFQVCIGPINQEIARYELRAWGM